MLVVAPAAEASGTGTMVTTRRDLQIAEVPARIDGVKAYTVDGTPADAANMIAERFNNGFPLDFVARIRDLHNSGKRDPSPGAADGWLAPEWR